MHRIVEYSNQNKKQDMNKLIHPEEQFNFHYIYYEDIYIIRDINKSIYYFSQAVNQNHSEAQFFLGRIYYERTYIVH